MPRIIVTENITGEAMDRLRVQPGAEVLFDPNLWNDKAALIDALGHAEALIVRNQTQVTEALIAAAPELKIIARAGAGLDNIDVEAAGRAGVVVSFTPNENSLSVAELTLGLMLSLARKIPQANSDTRNGGWNRPAFTGFELSGKTLGIVGIGRIGTLVAQRAKAFDMKLVAHDNYADPGQPHFKELGIAFLTLEELLNQADFVSVHVPLTKETHHLVNKERLAHMKSTACLINTSRGETIEESALIEALETGAISAAALDVRECEPPAAGNRLANMDNVISTPHIAAFTREAQERVVAGVCADVIAVLSDQPAHNFFNFPKLGGKP